MYTYRLLLLFLPLRLSAVTVHPERACAGSLLINRLTRTLLYLLHAGQRPSAQSSQAASQHAHAHLFGATVESEDDGEPLRVDTEAARGDEPGEGDGGGDGVVDGDGDGDGRRRLLPLACAWRSLSPGMSA